MNITEDYVSFEVAKLLKEKGFHEPCIATYNSTTKNFQVEEIYEDWTIHWKGYISVPTQQMAMKWLREKHKLYIGINIEVGDIQMLPSYDFEETVLGYNFVIYNEETLMWAFKDKTTRSYEGAVESALKYCLENLI